MKTPLTPEEIDAQIADEHAKLDQRAADLKNLRHAEGARRAPVTDLAEQINAVRHRIKTAIYGIVQARAWAKTWPSIKQGAFEVLAETDAVTRAHVLSNISENYAHERRWVQARTAPRIEEDLTTWVRDLNETHRKLLASVTVYAAEHHLESMLESLLTGVFDPLEYANEFLANSRGEPEFSGINLESLLENLPLPAA